MIVVKSDWFTRGVTGNGVCGMRYVFRKVNYFLQVLNYIFRTLAGNFKPLNADGAITKERDLLASENVLLREELRRALLPTGYYPEVPNAVATKGLCELVNPNRYLDKEWMDIHLQLERYSIDKHCFSNRSGAIYRKGWEWTHCVYGLKKLGMLEPSYKAIGVGAGREPVIFYLAEHISSVMATDLYGEQGWISTGGQEADLTLVEECKKICPPTVDFSKITFENQNGAALTYEDNSFDFAWSLSSIEHFGGHSAASQAIREMARVIRPGGVIAVATEMLLLEEHAHPEFFTKKQIEEYLINPFSGTLELVDEINYDTLSYEYLLDSISLPQGVHRRRRHVVLNDGEVQWTSIMLFYRKK